MDEIVKNKKIIRQKLLKIRDNLGVEQVKEHSERLCEHLLGNEELQRCKTVFCYLSNGSEIDLMPFIAKSWLNGVNIVVPVCSGRPYGVMDAAEYTPQTELVSASFGIREPQQHNVVSPEQIDTVLLPAVAFTRDGVRLGYGGGYYDRFLPQLRDDVLLIGIAHKVQITDELPKDEYDVPVGIIYTEDGAIKCK